MSSLIDTLYPLPDVRRTPFSLLRWWESRRWVYNRVVGMTGLVTLAGALVLHPAREHLLVPELAIPVLIYGVMANVCYSFGWMTELVAHALWGRDAPDMGPLLFRHGLVFAVGLTLFPLFLLLVFRVLAALAGLVGLVG